MIHWLVTLCSAPPPPPPPMRLGVIVKVGNVGVVPLKHSDVSECVDMGTGYEWTLNHLFLHLSRSQQWLHLPQALYFCMSQACMLILHHSQ